MERMLGSGYTDTKISSDVKSFPFTATCTKYLPASANLGGLQVITPSFTNLPAHDRDATGGPTEPLSRVISDLVNLTTIVSAGQKPKP